MLQARRQARLRQILMTGSSTAILLAYVLMPPPVQATDITISSSITTGTVWSGTLSPGSNLTITSSGTINTANPYGVTVTGTAGSTLGTLLNDGQIIDTATGGRAIFIQAGSVAAIVNTGSISGTYSLFNDGSLGALTNSGTIVGAINSTGTLGTIANSGQILGDVSSANRLTVIGGSSGAVGTFTGNGTVRSTITDTAGIVFAGGSLLIDDNVNVGSDTLLSQGTNLTVAANTTITGNYRQTLSTNTLTTSGLTVTGRVTLAGGTIIPSFSALGNYIVGTAAPVLFSPTGITNLGAAFGTAVAPTGARFSNIGASGTTLVFFNPLIDYVGGTLASITVGSTVLNGSSTIFPTAVYIASTGNLGTLSNTGTIRGNIINLSANDLNIRGGAGATVGTLTGFGGSIGTILNTLSNINLVSGNIRLNNNVNVGSNTFTNSGGQLSFNTVGTETITGNFAQTSGVLALNNARLAVSGSASITGGTILASVTPTNNYVVGDTLASSLVTLISAGSASNYNAALSSSGAGINLGSVASGNDLVVSVLNDYIGATYGTILNTGTLSSPTAVYIASTGTLGALSNTGIIQGNISNNSTGDLTIIGTGGTLTGSTGQGTITNTLSNVVFDSGSQLLNDAVNVSGHTLINNGAALSFNTLINVTGNYAQTGGSLLLGDGSLVVSGAASITGATVTTNLLSATGNYLTTPISATLVAAGTTSSYTSITASSNAITGVTVAGSTVVGNNLLLSFSNNYVGGTLATLTNTGAVNAATAVYIAATGNLGTLVNSGTLAGDINNLSAQNLTITGGTSGTIGTLTGQSGVGTIVNALSNLFFTSGNLLLNDQIVATGHTVSNSGASLTLNSIISITGNYAQTAGTLDLSASGSGIVISGSANITGGTIATSLVSTGNYLVGSGGTTLVSAGAASSYSGVNVATNSLTGVDSVSSTVIGNNLLLQLSNHYVGGTLGTLNNNGSVNAANAVYIAATGNLGSLVNSGTLSGDILNLSSSNLTIAGGGAGTIGTLTGTTGQGTITNTLSNLVLASGNLLLNDSIVATGHTVSNLGANVTLSTIVNVTGDYTQTSGTLGLGSVGRLVVSGAASITGGVISASGAGLSSTSSYFFGSAGGTLVSGGAGSNYTGVSLTSSGGITGLAASGAASGTNLVFQVGNYYVGDSQTSIGNTATITGVTYGVYVASTGTLGTLSNSGTLTSNDTSGAGVSNNSTITTVVNSGLISGAGKGFGNQSTIVSLLNSAGGTILGGTAAGLQNDTSFGTVTNAGYISSGSAGVANYGTLGLLTNSGSINGGPQGVYLDGSSNLTSLSNSGTITASQSAVQISGGLAVLTNSGLIGNASNALNVAGTLGALTNQTGGTINGVDAVYVSGSLGSFSNSGVIRGRINNQSANNLTITGGASGTVGTLTGQSGLGTIVNTLSNLFFASGNLLLNDRIVATGHTVSNIGASLTLNSIVSIAGSYAQTAGTLDLSASGSGIVISGSASITGGTVVTGIVSTGNYLAGLSTLVSAGATSNYTGVNVTGGSISGLAAVGTVSGNNLVLNISNHYVGGTLGTLNNTGSVNAATAVYIAATGNLGSLVNSGTLSGNIVNLASRDLTIAGGTSGTIGTLTGTSGQGTITSTLGNVVLASGSLLLNDRVNVGSGTLINSGASASLASITSVTGNYTQSGGQLVLNAGAQLVVSGAANITGGTIAANLSATGNYAPGLDTTLVSVGAASTVSGVVTVTGLSGLITSSTLVSNNLVLTYGNHYVGGTLGSLSNTGSVSAATAVYIAATGNLGSLVNTGTLSGNITNLAARGLTIVGGTSGTIGTLTGGTITSTGANVVLASGNLVLGDSVNVGSNSLVNSGASVTLARALAVTGNYSQSSGVLNVGSNILSVSGAAQITGGTIATNLSATGNYLVGSGGTLVAGGGGSSYSGASIALGGVAGLAAISTVSGNNLLLSFTNDYVGGSLSAIDNTGLLSAGTAIYIAATGNLGALNNSGTINGNITNLSSNALVINGGSTAGTFTGGAINSANANVVLGSGNIVLDDTVNVGSNALVNSGASVQLAGALSVSGNYTQTAGQLVVNGNVLSVSGVANISGGTIVSSVSADGNYLAGSQGTTLIAGGAGSSYGGASIQTGVTGLAATGTASGNSLLLAFANDYVGGSLSAIDNTGLLSAATAVYIAATGNLGALNNSGTINGNITNLSSNALVINGGAGTGAGTLTGGAITSTGANVVLASGSLVLGDSVNVGSNSLINSGASVTLAGALAVTGNYSQTSGVLNVGSNILSVSGAAEITGGTIATNLSATGNYIVGSGGTLVAGGAGSSYSGASIALGGVTGLAARSTVSGNNLLLSFTNDYVGGSLSAIDNTGLLSAATAVYIAATGNLGALNNSGTINGNITNLSSNALVINGGAATGTFTGGAITSTNANVVLGSGNILLGDAVNVGANALVNSGASVQLAGALSVTGNYRQTAGQLDVNGNVLSVSGAANISGGTIVSNVSAGGNYLAGSQGTTLIAGGAGSSYGGASIQTGVTGLAATGTASGNNLVLAFANDYVGGSLSAIDNTGLLSAATAVYIAATGNLGALNNSGTINGNITNLSGNALVINGGTGTAGAFTGGAITSTGANVVLASGNLVLGDSVNVGSNSLINSGASVTLAGALAVTGNYSQSSGVLDVGSNILSVSGAAQITGGTIAANLSATGNYLVGSGGTLIAGGAGSSYSGASIVLGGVTGLGASSAVSGNNLLLSFTNDYVGGNLSAIDNTGLLSAGTAVYIAATGNLGALNNSGTINGNITNLSSNALVINGGSGAATGTFTGGAITSTNANVVLGSGNIVLNDTVNVGSNALVNSGASVQLAGALSVSGNYRQTAGQLVVNGNVLSVSGAANVSGGTIVSNVSAGGNYLAGSQGATLIAGGAGSSYSGASVQTGVTGLAATGTASGNNLVLAFANDYVGGSLSAINNTGLLSAATAVYIAATGNLGALNNSGTINGNITNLSSNALVINGGAGTGAGTLTGGAITSTGANVVLASGNLVLGDSVNVGSNSLVNSGASVTLAGALAVTGNYSQTSGVLNVGSNILSVSGAARITGGTIATNLSATGNYLVGSGGTLVAGGAGSSYSGASIVVGGLTGLAASSTVSGNNLLLSFTNDYVGGSLSAINNTGLLSAATAVHIAATGNLGALNNSGTINGNITNLSSNALVINGGSGAVTGSFTGGSITSTNANVVLASGNIRLGDAVNVGSNALVNSGASVQLAGALSVTGNYRQTAGRLDVNGNVLSVSGAANISGGTIVSNLSTGGNYLVGSQGATLIAGGAGSSYSGASVQTGVTGLDATGVTAGNNLVLSFANNYVGGSLGNLTNSGSLSAVNAVYIASTGSLGTLTNAGTIAGDILNLSSRELAIAGGTSASPGLLTGRDGALGRIISRSADLRFISGETRLNSTIDVGTNNVVNAGATLRIDTPISITGNFTQTAGTLAFGVGSSTTYGSLVVSGTSSLTGGTVTLTPLTGTPFTSGQSYTIVQSGGAINLGSLSFTASGFNITPSVVSAGGVNDLIVQLNSNFTEVGVVTGGAAVGTGAALDQIAVLTPASSPTAVAVQTQVLTPLAQLTPVQQQEAITQLSPSQLTPQLAVVIPASASAAVAQRQQVTSNALESGQRGLAAGGRGEKGAVWGQLLGNNVRRGTDQNAAGYKGNTAGLITGVDWFPTEEVAVGAAFSWLRSKTDGRGPVTGSTTKINSYQLTSYANWRPEWADGRLSAGVQLGAGYNDFNQKRFISFLQREAKADYGGKQYLGKVEAGYDLFKWGEQVITPKWSLRSVRLINNPYTETGAGVADLQVLRIRTDALTQELGVQAKTSFDSFLGPTTLDLETSWVHDYLNGPIATTGVLAGVTFTSTSDRPSADGFAFRFGATVAHSDAVDFRLEYSGEARRKFFSNTIITRATIHF